MARHDGYRARRGPGWLRVVQADLLDGLPARVVVPLLPPDAAPPPIRDLNPRFEIDGQAAVMVTQYIAAVPRTELGRPVAWLGDQHDVIIRAFDTLLSGV